MIVAATYLFIFLSLALTNIASATCDHLPPNGISPLFSFGHSLLSKNEIAVSEELLILKTKPHPAYISIPQAYYGINNRLTLSCFIPIVYQKQNTDKKSSGLGDIYGNINIGLYNKKTKEYNYRIIGVAGMRFPTATGALEDTLFTLKTTSFFVGVTYDALTHNWYLYSDFGALFFTKKKNNLRFGTLIPINIGIGRTLCLKEHYITTFVELSNFYSRPDRVRDRFLLNTGGNILFIGPTLRYAHNGWLTQIGIQWNIAEHLRNQFDTIKYIAGGFIAYSF